MRLLIACPECKRQYDATGRPAGSRFRCRCGAIVTIARPQGHDASVIRCSSCGAPRRDGASHCQFCGADFTLREQDLDTICPHCLARIGDHAKFCDHCGHPLAAEPLSIEETTLLCPFCCATTPGKAATGPRLHSRLVSGSSVLECSSCTGIWVGAETFRQMVEAAGREAQHCDHRDPQPVPKSCTLEGAKPHGYLPCPVCRELMVRQNFGHGSGVIVDVCKPHGIWFDAEKLTCILDWVRSGGLAAANEQREAELDRAARVEGRVKRERLKETPGLAGGSESHDSDFLGVFSLLSSMFGL
jgi:Zn-finger nucleic acid-binding protein